jgi:hypothetical protein
MGALDEPQILIFHAPHGHHHFAAVGELRQERRWYGWRRSSHQDSFIRRKLGQPERTVSALYVHVRVAEVGQALGSLGRKCGAKLHTENLARQTREHGGLISKSRSNFQNAFVPLQPKRRSHGRYDVRLRNGLTFTDGERRIFVCARAKLSRNKFVPRNAFQAL